MRLIDADALDNIVLQLIEEGRKITNSEYKMLDSIIFEFPTIEAEPVRRGKWIENRGDIICSQCGIEIPEEITWLRGINAEGPFFCPNCGAKMEV